MEIETWQVTGLGVLMGSVIPAIITMLLPRSGTVKFGMFVYKAMGLAFGQKRATQIGIPAGAWGNFLLMIRTTFTDLSFGIYIASREDLNEETRQEKIEKYFDLHKIVQDTKKDD